MHLSKLLLLKGFNTLTLRYGVFFSQNRWYGVRKIKVMFLRRGRQFFAWLRRFWGQYATWQKTVVLLAFFPLVVVLFILGLSFNITRKTMVTQAQGGMVLKTAKAATSKNKGLTSWFKRIDQVTLAKIKQLQGKN